MASFDIAIAKTLKYEGSKYVMDTNGYGAKYGINEQYNPGIDVKNLTLDEAKAIYKKKYWSPYFDKIANQELANQIFDWRVTSSSYAIKGLQAVINSYGNSVTVDGGLGPETMNYLSKLPVKEFLERYYLVRISFYNNLHLKDPVKYNKNVLNSWISRTNDNYTGSKNPPGSFVSSYNSSLRASRSAGDTNLMVSTPTWSSSIGIVKPLLVAATAYGLFKLYQMWQQNQTNKGPAYV